MVRTFQEEWLVSARIPHSLTPCRASCGSSQSWPAPSLSPYLFPFPAPPLLSHSHFIPSTSSSDFPPFLSILLGPHLSCEAGPLWVRDVILPQVPV